MLKSGMLPAPVISPLRHEGSFGTKIKVGPNTYIQIRSDVAGSRVYFTTDGTKPTPFQTGRTGKASTHKYIGPFRLQLGNRVVRAICVSRDKLRESPITTKYIDVLIENEHNSNSDHEQYYYDSASDEEPRNEFIDHFNSARFKVKKRAHEDFAEVQGSVDGPINPINYSGTQINVWGIPPGDLTSFLEPKPKPPNVGYLTDQMIRNLNTPRPAIESEKKPLQNDFASLPEALRKLFKQLQKLYERDSDFQNGLDYLMENGQVKSADIEEKYNAFSININCPKFLVDEPPKPKPKPKPIINQQHKPRPRSPSPEIQIIEKPTRPQTPSPPRPPKPQIISKPYPEPQKPQPAPPKQQPDAPKPQPAPIKIQPQPPKKQEPAIYIEENIQNGTVVDAPNFNAEHDAEALRKSVKGLGTDEQVIINIMGNRSNAQRLKIKDVYKSMFGRELVEDLKGDTSGNFKKLLTMLLLNPVEFDCVEIRKAIQGLGTDDSVLIEILSSRSNKRIKEMSQLYFQMYKKKMEDDVQSDTSGHYRKLLTSLLTASRPETNEVDMNQVRKDADELIQAGVKKWGTDEAKFNTIFCTRSYAHLRQLFNEYQDITKKSMEDTIKSEMSGNLSKTYIALINNVRSRPGYFAKEIKKAIKGLGTDEHTLNRIIVSRCEIDTIQIKEEYQKLFKNSMEKDIKSDVSGDYGRLLLLLLLNPSDRIYENNSSEPDEPHVIEQVEEPLIEKTPTLTDYSGFDPNSDCEKLRKAMKGFGTDEKTIIEILGRRTNKQRQILKNVFQSMFGRDLLKDLHSELSGSFRDTIEGMMMPPDEFDASQYKKAIKGLGTDETALVELLTTRSAEEINAAKAKYQSLYGKTLESDIIGDTSGDFKRVLVSLLSASRPTGNLVDKTQAKIDAQELINAGIKKWGTDESKFLTILCTRSYAQLRATFDSYEHLSGHSFEDDLKKETSGDLYKVFSAIAGCVRDYQAHFATLLYKAMKGLGTKESVLTRIIVTRCEVDMVQIKQKFEKLFKTKLVDYIKGDTSGDFCKTLLTLIG